MPPLVPLTGNVSVERTVRIIVTVETKTLCRAGASLRLLRGRRPCEAFQLDFGTSFVFVVVTCCLWRRRGYVG